MDGSLSLARAREGSRDHAVAGRQWAGDTQ